MELVLNEKELLLYCKEFCKTTWNEEMEIPVEISGRLTRAFGSFRYGKKSRKPRRIIISKRLLTGSYKMETVLSVVKHELCHYHLCRNNLEFSDNTPIFDKEALRIGATLTQTIITSGNVKVGYCSKCHDIIIYNAKPRHINGNYISNCCNAKIYYKDEYREDKTEVSLSESDKEFLNKIHKDKKEIKTIKETLKDLNFNGLNINEIVKPGKRGVTRAQVHPAVEQAVDEQSIEKLKLIKQIYPEYFRQVCIYINKKRLSYLKEIGLAE